MSPSNDNMYFRHTLVIAVALAFYAFAAAPSGGSDQSPDPQREGLQTLDQAPELAPFVSTPMKVVHAMLELAGVTRNDVLYDLGSGDGRIVIAAAREYGARAVGFEIDLALVLESRENVREASVDHLVEIRQQDILKVDFSEATVVTLYLFPDANLMLRPLLQRQLKAGARVVSSQFDMGDWQANDSIDIQVAAADSGAAAEHGENDETAFKEPETESYTLYLWQISGEPELNRAENSPESTVQSLGSGGDVSMERKQ